MSFLTKLAERLGIYEDEEEFEEEELTAESAKQGLPGGLSHSESESQVAPEMSGFAPVEEAQEPVAGEQEVAVEEVRRPKSHEVTMKLSQDDVDLVRRKVMHGGQKKSDLVAVEALAQALHVVIIQPADFDDSQKIADFLREGQPVIVNFEETQPVHSKRISDFVSGVVHALGGTMKRIGHSIVLCAPHTVDIDSNSSEFYATDVEPWNE